MEHPKMILKDQNHKSTQDLHTDIYLDSFDSNKYINNSTILDVGCGGGYASRQFIKRGAKRVISMDPSTKLTENNRPIWLTDIPSYFTTTWEDVEDLKIQFDIVWHHHVVEHVEDCFNFFRKIHSLIVDNGWMWMACPNMAQHSTFSPGHVHNFQAAQLIEVLKRCNFGVEDARIWVIGGQLRVRVPKNKKNNYPTPMRESLNKTGRCPSDILRDHRWRE